jgi:hypothetical protein
MMYYVQWAEPKADWHTEIKYHSLGAALRHACVEAQMVSEAPYRVIKIKENGKVKVLAKFKPMRDV